MSPNTRMVIITAAFFWFVGWLWKIHFFGLHFWGGFSIGLEHSLFPTAMLHSGVGLFFYMLPLVVGLPLLVGLTRQKALIVSGVMFLSSLGCLSHIHFFNDATFTTALWASVWLFWFSWNCERNDSGFAVESQWLVKGTVAMVFLGGFIGKLTPTYWSGEVLHDVYFLQKDYFFYPWLRGAGSEELVRQVARIFSRGAVLGEGLLVAAIVFRYRFYALLALAVMVGMVVISTPYLFSVMSPLVGIVVANLRWKQGVDIEENSSESAAA